MQNLQAIFILLAIFLAPSLSLAVDPMSDLKIRQVIVEGSINAYLAKNGTSSCPCPFNEDRGGQLCGSTSAYFNEVEDKKPKCYPNDVEDVEVDVFRIQNDVFDKDVEKPL